LRGSVGPARHTGYPEPDSALELFTTHDSAPATLFVTAGIAGRLAKLPVFGSPHHHKTRGKVERDSMIAECCAPFPASAAGDWPELVPLVPTNDSASTLWLHAHLRQQRPSFALPLDALMLTS
jgi:hypothetical protein